MLRRFVGRFPDVDQTRGRVKAIKQRQWQRDVAQQRPKWVP